MMNKHVLIAVACAAALVACDKRSAEQIGKDLAQEKVDIVKGAGEVVKNEGGGVANTMGQAVGNVFTGLSKGLDTSLVKQDIRVTEELKPLLTVGRAQPIEPSYEAASGSADSKKKVGVNLYLVSEPGYKGKVMLLAYQDANEVGRSLAPVDIEKSGATNVDFAFDERTPLKTVTHFALKEAAK